MIREVTLWFKYKCRIYNHFEEGHSQKGTPTYYNEYQKQGWKSAIWSKRWAYLIGYNDDIPKVDPDYWSE